MKAKNIILNFFRNLKDDIDCFKLVVSEKGLLFILRPVLIGGAIFMLLYVQIYEKGNKAIFLKQDAIEAKRIQAENMESYLKDKARLSFFLRHMPKLDDKSSWLLDTITTILEQNKVQATNISEQKEQKKDNFILVTIKISASMSYEELGKVIESVENNQQFLKVIDLDVVKSTKGILGYNDVNMSIGTIFYSPRKTEVIR